MTIFRVAVLEESFLQLLLVSSTLIHFGYEESIASQLVTQRSVKVEKGDEKKAYISNDLIISVMTNTESFNICCATHLDGFERGLSPRDSVCSRVELML